MLCEKRDQNFGNDRPGYHWMQYFDSYLYNILAIVLFKVVLFQLETYRSHLFFSNSGNSLGIAKYII